MRAPRPLLAPPVGSLAPFVDAGVLGAPELHVAAAVSRATGESRTAVLLGVALAARAPQYGHVCVVLADAARTTVVDDARIDADATLEWPDPSEWSDALLSSPAVRSPGDPPGDTTAPLVFDGGRLYLDRYWHFEQRVADALLERAATARRPLGTPAATAIVLDSLFGPQGTDAPDRQRTAVELALSNRLAVVGGGPGTGKTRTIARLLAAVLELSSAAGRPLDVALAAPTGKAAARLTVALRSESGSAPGSAATAELLLHAEASTLHRLLGGRPGGSFRHDRRNPLPHDLVVVDESSMVSLPLMARLLDAVRPEATVVLVGDPYQLASVEAGAVLGEIVGPATVGTAAGPLAGSVVLLERVHRFGAGSAIASLSESVRTGDPQRAIDILRDPDCGEADWVRPDDDRIEQIEHELAAHAIAVVRLAREGDATGALELAGDLTVLCATRHGGLGVERVTARIEALAAIALPEAAIGHGWYVGRPVVVTSNDYAHRLFNGDVGVVAPGHGRPAVVFPGPAGLRSFATSQLPSVDTWWATTIHKSQGSEFRRVVVTLPAAPSPILTRELLYTAVTRAREHVTVVASEASLRAAISRPIARASGLGTQLWP